MRLLPINPRAPFDHVLSSGIKRTWDESGSSLLAQKLKMSNRKENTTLRSLRCPHLVLLSPVCLPGTEAINRTLQKKLGITIANPEIPGVIFIIFILS